MFLGLQRTEIILLSYFKWWGFTVELHRECVCILFSLPVHFHLYPPLSLKLPGWSSPYFSVQIPERVCLPINYLTSIGQSFSCQVILQPTHLPMNWLPSSQVCTSSPISRHPVHNVQVRATSFIKALWTKAAFLRKGSRCLKHTSISNCH